MLWKSIKTVTLAIGLAGLAQPALAQNFPNRSVTSIVAFGAGGGTDVVARALVRYAPEFIGQEIAVENRTGGAGAIGMTALAQSRPDGYTIGTINFELLAFKPLGRAPIGPENFRPVLRIQSAPLVLAVRADAPWNTLKEFIDAAKANGGKTRIAASPPGAVWNVAAGLVAEATGTQFNVVPFDGGSQMAVALLGGQVEATTVSLQEVIDHVKAGKLKLLALGAKERHAAVPNVPTFTESGYDIVFGSWQGIAMPKNVPDQQYTYLADALKKMFDDKRFRQFAEENTLTLDYADGAEFEKFLADQAVSVQAILKKQGLIVE